MVKIKNIKELAEIAGVSMGGASMIMSGKWHKKVKKSVAEHVLAVAAKHNYEINPLGRSLQLGQHMRISLVMEGLFLEHPLIGAFSFHDLFAAITDAVSKEGYSVDVFQLDREKIAQIKKRKVFSLNTDGMIFLEWNTQNLKGLLEAAKPNKPYVIIGSDLSKYGHNSIVRDTENSTYLAIKHLISRWHKRIAVTRISGSLSRFNQKIVGYKRALEEANIQFDDALILYSELHESFLSTGITLGQKLLDLTNRPTACFCDDNIDAVGILIGLSQHEIKIPLDFEIISYGDSAIGNIATIPLSYLEIPSREMANSAVSYLFDMIKNKHNLPVTCQHIPEKLIFQKTTK